MYYIGRRAPPQTWSGRCSFLFRRAARRRDCVQDASAIIKYDIAREDAVRFRHLTAAQGSRASERVREERYNLPPKIDFGALRKVIRWD